PTQCQRLMRGPCIAPIIATGIVAAISMGEALGAGAILRPGRAATTQHRRPLNLWLHLQARQQVPATLLTQAAKVLLLRPQNWRRIASALGSQLRRPISQEQARRRSGQQACPPRPSG